MFGCTLKKIDHLKKIITMYDYSGYNFINLIVLQMPGDIHATMMNHLFGVRTNLFIFKRSGTFRQPRSGSRKKDWTRILNEQNIDQNHKKIIPIFSKRKLFLWKPCNMAIIYSYKIWPLSKNLVSTLKGIKITKNSEIFRKYVWFKQDPEFWKPDPDLVKNCLDLQHW